MWRWAGYSAPFVTSMLACCLTGARPLGPGGDIGVGGAAGTTTPMNVDLLYKGALASATGGGAAVLGSAGESVTDRLLAADFPFQRVIELVLAGLPRRQGIRGAETSGVGGHLAPEHGQEDQQEHADKCAEGTEDGAEHGAPRAHAARAPRPQHRRRPEPARGESDEQGEDHKIDASVKVIAAANAEQCDHAQYGEEEGNVRALAYGR